VCGQADKFPENAGITLLLYQMNWSRLFEYAGQCGTNCSQRFPRAMVLYGRGSMLRPSLNAEQNSPVADLARFRRKRCVHQTFQFDRSDCPCGRHLFHT
jgi:hypothetical protein